MCKDERKKEDLRDEGKLALETISRQLKLAVLGATVAGIISGIHGVASGIMVPSLTEGSNSMHITTNQESWIASLGVFAAPIAALIAGPIVDYFGRKLGMQLCLLFYGVGFSTMALARDVTHIYVGRTLCAVGEGFGPYYVTYLTEICTERQRSTVLWIAVTISAVLGETTVFIMDAFLIWNVSFLLFSLTCLIMMFYIHFILVESPQWLFFVGRKEDAKCSLRILGKNESALLQEIEYLKQVPPCKLTLMLNPTVWKPLGIITSVFFIQCMTGIYCIQYYTMEFVDSIGTSYNSLTVSTLVFSVKFIAVCTVGCYCIAVMDRKLALALSGFWMGVFSVTLAIYEYVYRESPMNERPYQWFVICLVVLHTISSTFGVVDIPQILCGELFPMQARGVMMSFGTVILYFIMFFSIQSYNTCLASLKIFGCLLLYGSFAFIMCCYSLFVLPETQNKSLLTIQKSFIPTRREEFKSSQIQLQTIEEMQV